MTINIGTIDIGTIDVGTIDVGTIDMRYVSGLNDIGDILRRTGCGLAPGRKIVIELSNRQSRGRRHRRVELLPGVQTLGTAQRGCGKKSPSMPSPEAISKFFDVAEAMA
jgi:hypothetical protein